MYIYTHIYLYIYLYNTDVYISATHHHRVENACGAQALAEQNVDVYIHIYIHIYLYNAYVYISASHHHRVENACGAEALAEQIVHINDIHARDVGALLERDEDLPPVAPADGLA